MIAVLCVYLYLALMARRFYLLRKGSFMSSKKIAGTCYIKVDGAQLEVAGGVEFPLMNVKRETVMADAGAVGFSEVAIAPYVKLSAKVPRDFPVAKLQKATDMTVTVEAANGMVYTLSDAFVQGEPGVNASEGSIDLEFGGLNGELQ